MAKISTHEAFTSQGLPRARFLNESIKYGSIDPERPFHPTAFDNKRFFRILRYTTARGVWRYKAVLIK